MEKTVLMEHTFMNGYEHRMRLLKNSDIYGYFNMLDLSNGESERIANSLMYAAYAHGCVKIERDMDMREWRYLHRSPKYGGDLQLTTWDEYGPVSDSRVSSAKDISCIMCGRMTAKIENNC